MNSIYLKKIHPNVLLEQRQLSPVNYELYSTTTSDTINYYQYYN